MSNLFRLNDFLREAGAEKARWRVANPVPSDGFIELFDREKGEKVFRKFFDLSREVSGESLILVREGQPLVSPAAQADPDLEHRTKLALEYLRIVEEIKRRWKVSFNAAYLRAAEEHAKADEGSPFPSRPTLYRYAEARRNGLPVLRGDKNKGNRTPRYAPTVIELITQAAEEKYLVRDSRWELGDLVDYVNCEARKNGLTATNTNITTAYVAKVIFEELTPDPEIDRMDPKLVAAAKSFAANRIVTFRPFERVEQDALHLPFVIKTPYGTTNNVWLVHAIDCSMGMPVGWHLVIGPPAESDGLKCVECTLFSKQPAFQRLGIATDIDVFGTPNLLVFDNGAEARGQRMGRLVRIGINVKYLKSRHPHRKPFIERLNRALKKALQLLGGCTRLNGKDGARDPIKEGDELMTLEELERWIVRWYFEEWARHELKRHLISDFHDRVKLGSTPERRWIRMTQELSISMPLAPRKRDWQMCLYEHDEGTLNRKTGITTQTFNYRIGNLKYLLDRYGETKMKFYRNPDDYRTIFVDDGEDKPWVPLVEEHVTDATPAYSFAQIRDLLEKNAASSTPGQTSAFRQDVFAAADASGKPKKMRQSEKNKAVADAHKDTAARRRAAESPLPAAPDHPPQKQDSIRAFFGNEAPLQAVNRSTGEAL